jgi:cyanoexosortase A
MRDALNATLQRAPAWLGLRNFSIPPATPRNLWLLLATAVATQNLAVFQSSQNEHITVFAALVWGGALICMEDQLEDLTPRPSRWGLALGIPLLLWVLLRTGSILHWDGLIFALPPVAGLALALLCEPPRGIGRFRDSLLCLLMVPAFNIIALRMIPEGPFSVLTANLSGFWLAMLGYETQVTGRTVMLPTGGVEVLPACNGVDTIAQVICISLIFLLAFPLRSRLGRVVVLVAAPLIGLACNTMRIAILALCVANGHNKGSDLFRFFHDDLGSLLFSGVAVFVFGLLYMRVLERELPPLQTSNQEEA